MYIPLISKRQRGGTLEQSTAPAELAKRRGGRGGGGGGGRVSSGSSGGSRGSSGSSSGGSTGSRPPAYSPGSPPPPYSVAGGSAVRGNTNSVGGGRPFTVGSGNAFAGRSAGGGTRQQVYGGSRFGGGALVGAAAFPFIFWPLAFSGGYGNYYGSQIYGPPSNDTRPGGALSSYTLLPTWGSSTTNGAQGPDANTFFLYGDTTSINDLVPILASNCSVINGVYGQNITAEPPMGVEYYRGSTFSLMLNGYNNSLPNIEAESSATNDLSADVANAQPAPLPSGVNATYLDCLNSTIINNIGLLDSDVAQSSGISVSPSLLHGALAVGLLLRCLY